MKTNKIYQGNALEVLKTFPDNPIDCCVTSPPYWGLRDYGVKGQLGLEKTPEEFVQKLATIFDEVKRVLKPTGTLWLNLGDSYVGGGFGASNYPATNHKWKQKTNGGTLTKGLGKDRNYSEEYKPKDLVGIPWLVAFELRRRGWYLRQDIIWSKPNPMPESVTDRCTKAHEYIFLLSKSNKYFFDSEAIKTEMECSEHDKRSRQGRKRFPTELINGIRGNTPDKVYEWANKRSVWSVTTQSFSEAHFATFPENLISDCIKAGTSSEGCCAQCGKPYERVIEKSGGSTGKGSWTKHEHDSEMGMSAPNTTEAKQLMRNGTYKVKTLGWQPTCKCKMGGGISASVVLDPFMGAGTTALISKKFGRNYIGIELNPKYISMSEKRLYNELGMFYE